MSRDRCEFCGNRVNQAGQARNKPVNWRTDTGIHTAHAGCFNRAARETRRATKNTNRG